MKPDEYQQHYLDGLVLQLADAASYGTQVYTVTHMLDHKTPPSLDEVLGYAEWSWSIFVKAPIERLLEDVSIQPTEFEDVHSHFIMMQRRRHLEAVEMMNAFISELDDQQEVDDQLNRGYL